MALALAASCQAHDTWLERSGAAGEALFSLGTANRFPRHEEPVDARVIAQSHCVDGQGLRRPLESLRMGRRFTLLRAPGLNTSSMSCAVQLQPLDVELSPELVGVYFREIGAGPEILRAWEAQRRRGTPFQERYVKVARYDGLTAAIEATPWPIDLRRVRPEQPLVIGQTLLLELRRDARALKGLPLEVLHEKSAQGIWLRSDEQGLIRVMIDKPGKWLVRGVELTPPVRESEPWSSRFIAYTFDVPSP